MIQYQNEKFLKCFLIAVVLTVISLPTSADEKADKTADEQSLTSYVQSEGSEKLPIAGKTDNTENQEEQKTWLNNLVGMVSETGANALNPADTTLRPIHRSNASVFDISGVMLRMNQSQVASALLKRGYRKTKEHSEIPNFIRWRYEEMCRNQGIVGYEQLASCVQLMAKKNGYIYVQQESYFNFHTKENIDIFYTSNFTNNKVLFNTIRALKLGVSDGQDRQELVKLMDQIQPGEYKFPNQAAKALVTKYAKYWEGKHHECWESR